MREWNGEENSEQESGLIFLTHAACRRDVWAPPGIKATKKNGVSSVRLDHLLASNVFSLAVDSVSTSAKADICFSSQETHPDTVRLCGKGGCFQASRCTVDAAGTSRMPDS